MEPLIKHILDGNPEGFRQIIRQYEDQLLKTAFRFFHDWDDARDATQNTFIAVHKHLNRFDTTKPFAPWIHRIHLNQCRSLYRKKKVWNGLKEAIGLRQTNEPIHPETGEYKFIQSCVAQLSWHQKTAFILMEIEGYSSAEAGERMGCADGTARVHLKRAKENLKKKLEG